jgi:hypothetical protein
MPEALAVLVVIAVCIIVYVAAWLRSRDPSLINVAEDLQRLRHHEAWLRERLLRAMEERWSDDMVSEIANELHATSLQLSRLTVSGPSR